MEANKELTLEKYIQNLIENYELDIKNNVDAKNDGEYSEHYEKFISNEEVLDEFGDILASVIELPNQSLSKKIEEMLVQANDKIVSSGDKFRQTLNEKQRRLLALSRLFVEFCFAICKSYNLDIGKSREESLNKYNALFSINGVALRTFNEVLCLCESGYPEGAYAHGRVLFEYAAIASFLSSDTDEVSKAFLDSALENTKSEADHYKWALTSERFAEKNAEDIKISTFITEMNTQLQSRSRIYSMSNSKFRKPYDDKSVFIHASSKGVLARFRTQPGFINSFDVDRNFTGIEIAIVTATESVSLIMCYYLGCIKHKSFFSRLSALFCLLKEISKFTSTLEMKTNFK